MSEPPPVIAAPVNAAPVIAAPVNAAPVNSAATGLTADSRDVGYSLVVAWLWMVGSLAILTLAALMSVGSARRVYLPGTSFPMPETCMLHARFGLDCPGCGLTRSFIHLAHGRLADGFWLNPAGIVIFIFVAAQIPAAILRFVYGRASKISLLWVRCNEVALIVLPTLTFVQWIVRLAIGDYW